MYKYPDNSKLISYLSEHTNELTVTHTIRVVSFAEMLSSELEANKLIVVPAAILHDIEAYNGFKGHGKRGAKRFRKEFGKKYQGLTGHIAHCIEAHPVKYAPEPETIEAKCLNDADRIDAITSFIPQRYLAAMEKYGNEKIAWEETNLRIQGWYESMRTEIGKEMFLEIKERMRKIFPKIKDLKLY